MMGPRPAVAADGSVALTGHRGVVLAPSCRPRPDPASLAKLLIAERPQRETFDALGELLDATDWRRHGQLLAVLYAAKCHPWVFQIGLALVWKQGGGCRVVAEAAGTRKILKSWFNYARFDWPCGGVLAEAVTVYTPREMVLFRGGRGDPARLAIEYCWTPLRPLAAKYAIANPHPHPDGAGPPVIVRRTVTRSEVALHWIYFDMETVLLDEGPFEVDCTDVDELAELAEEARRLEVVHREQRAALIARYSQHGNIAR